MKHQPPVTQAAFDSLLAWLDPDRDRAAGKYEQIRARLIKLFTCRGRQDADELADETINRVTLKASEVAKGYVGDPSLYFYGVAQKVFLESLRRRPPRDLQEFSPRQAASPAEAGEDELEHECLERCLARLPEASRELVLDYYRDDRRAKIDHRKELAARLGVAPNALRIRVHRIRATLQECVGACVGQGLPA
jgi:RNA polymerase sigma factor (sigma-70 family)